MYALFPPLVSSASVRPLANVAISSQYGRVVRGQCQEQPIWANIMGFLFCFIGSQTESLTFENANLAQIQLYLIYVDQILCGLVQHDQGEGGQGDHWCHGFICFLGMGTNNFYFASVDQIWCCREQRVGEGRGVLVEPYPGEGGDDVWDWDRELTDNPIVSLPVLTYSVPRWAGG